MKNLKIRCLNFLNSTRIVFLFFIIYYIGRVGGNTAFVIQWPQTDKLFQICRMLGALFFGLETLKLAIGYIKDRPNWKQMMIILAFVALVIALGINFLVQGAYTFLTDILMAFVMSHIALKKTIRIRMLVCFAVCLIVPALADVGVLKNLVTARNSTMRYAVGFDYTTRVSGIYGFATLYYCYLKKFKLNARDIFMMVLSSLLIDLLTDTRTYFYLEVLFAVIAILVHFDWFKYFKKFCLAIETLFVDFFPLIAIVTLFLTLAYGQGGIFIKIDQILTNRLAQVYADLVNYGLHPFGHDFAQYGHGGAYTYITNVFGSNYIDSGFLQLLIIRGVVPFVIIVALLYVAIIQLKKHQMHYEIFLAFIIALLSTFSGGLMSNESIMFTLMFYGLRLLYLEFGKGGQLREK